MTDYTDLIARLRDGFPTKQGFSGYYPDVKAAVDAMTEAAAAIEALQAEVARLQGALDTAVSAPYWGDAQEEHMRVYDVLEASRAAYPLRGVTP